jgi:anaerobic magnesium-protoporphyrin IX monomethyl ester cyclase
MKRILLVNPHETAQSGFTNPPLGLLYLAGSLRHHGFEVKLVDACVEGKAAVLEALRDFRPAIVALTCLTPGRKKALELAELAKSLDPSATVVLGGAHPTILFRQILEHYAFVDVVVLGEGEQTIVELARGLDLAEIRGIAYRSGGRVVRTRHRENAPDLDALPFPPWDLVDFGKYQARGQGVFRGIDLARDPRVSVIFSRGCSGHCDFCSTWWTWKGWRHRSARNMVDELEGLYRRHGIRHFCFADDALTIDRSATIALYDEILARGLEIAFHATTRTDAVDEEVLRKLAAAGCDQISFGVESGSQAILERMGKANDVAHAERATRLAQECGLAVTALLIIGNVGETEETLLDTIRFLQRAQPTDVGCVGGLWILPGTKLYRECKERGFIDDSFWLGDEPYKVYTLEWPLATLQQMQQLVTGFRPVRLPEPARPPPPPPSRASSRSGSGTSGPTSTSTRRRRNGPTPRRSASS